MTTYLTRGEISAIMLFVILALMNIGYYTRNRQLGLAMGMILLAIGLSYWSESR